MPKWLSRHSGHSEEDVDVICAAIKRGDRIPPITARRVEDNKLELATGHKRLEAFIKWNTENPDKQKKVPCFIETDLDEEGAFALDVRTNVNAKAYSPVDQRKIAVMMENDYGWKGTRIAKLLNVHPSYLSQLKQLDGCSDKVKDLVDGKKLALNAAFMIVKCKEVTEKEEQDDICEKALALTKNKPGEEGKIDSAAVAKALRDFIDLKNPKAEEGEDDDSESGEEETEAKEPKEKAAKEASPYPKLTLAQVKEFLEAKRDGTGEKPSIRKMGDILYKLITGDMQLQTVDKKLDKLFPNEKASNASE